jgi:lipoprotein-releasing system permease protein
VRTALLLLLLALSLASPLAVWSGGPPWIVRAGEVGVGALVVLVLAWAVRGFVGFEHRAGLRLVLRRDDEGKARRKVSPWPLVLAIAATFAGVLALHLGLRSAAVALATAVAAGASMVLAISRVFAVFATLSIAGIALGVAALIVVQSVATGFQHEFERRVLGVYAHVNVTHVLGIAEHRRFEAYVRTLPGVTGASTFVYSLMALAPHAVAGDADAPRPATTLVKGIDPATAHEVIDLEAHLADAGHADVPISALRSEVELQPVRESETESLPAVIAATADPRGDEWFEPALLRWRALPDAAKHPSERARVHDDAWPDEVEPQRSTEPATLPTMFVGATLAQRLGLEVGDVVDLVDPGAGFDTSAAPQLRRYRIEGVFRAGFQEYDERLAYVHVAELQWLKWRGRDVVSGIDLRLADVERAPQIASYLRTALGEGYSAVGWQQLNATLFQSISTQKSILTVILSLVSAVAGFNVLAALWTMVVRRAAEIAILMAMGATESSVARIFQFSGMVLGAFGSLAGVALGLVLCWLVHLYGYSLDPEVYFIENLPVELSAVQLGAIAALTLGICFVATIPPALRAAKLRPVEGLRYE